MTDKQKNTIGATGFALLILAGLAFAAWTYYPRDPDGAYQKKIMAADISTMDGPAIEKFVRGLDANRLKADQKALLLNRLMNRFWELPPDQMAALLKSVRAEMQQNPNSPISINAQQLMQADAHIKADLYLKATPAQKSAMLDKEIAQQQTWQSLQGISNWRNNGLPTPAQADNLKTQIAFWMAQGMKTDNPTQRAAMTQFYTDMRQRRIDKGLPTLW